MFVEDGVGLVCKVSLSSSADHASSLEGHTVEFSNLTLTDRLPRDRWGEIFIKNTSHLSLVMFFFLIIIICVKIALDHS